MRWTPVRPTAWPTRAGHASQGVHAMLAILTALSLAVWPHAPAGAQTTTATVQGFVTDSAGAAASDITVIARDLSTNQTRTVMTSQNGFYSIGGLRPGSYQLRLQRVGFQPVVRPVQLLVGQTQRQDFQLTPTAVQLSEVVVSAAPSAVETRTSEVATNITQNQIRNLPTPERNFLDLAKLAPGIRIENPSTVFRGLQAGAQPAEQVNVFVDGASYKSDVLTGGVAGQDASQGNPFPQSAVQEFRVLTQNYKAEYQKAASAIITAVTRSGTNQWEADGFAFGVVPGLAGRDPFTASKGLPAPDYRRLQAGLNAGGPIVRDRLFFFGSYENNLRNQPSDVFLGGDSTKFPQLAQQLRPFTGRTNSQFRENLFFGKLTYTPGERHTLEVSGNVRRETDFRGFGTAFNAPQMSAQSAENFRNNVATGLVNYKYTVGRLLNQAQLNLQRTDWNPVPLNGGAVGQNYFGLLRIGGRDTRQQFTQGRVGLRDDITYSLSSGLGEHVLKGGVYTDFLQYKSEKNQYANPVFDYNPAQSTTVPFEAFLGYGNPFVRQNNTQFGGYVQDDWSVTRRLVLNLGLRWDAETNMIPSNYVTPAPLRDSLTGPLGGKFLPLFDSLGGFPPYISTGSNRKPYLRAFQPRVGLSYDISGDQRTVVFGGAGIYYDRDIWNYMLDERFRRQFTVLRIQFDTIGPRASCPACVRWDPKYLDRNALLQLAQSGQAGAPEVFLINNNTVPPKSYQFSAGVRQVVGPALLSATYAGSRGYNGFAFVRVTNWGGLLPTYAQAFASTNEIRTWFNSLLFQAEKPLRTGDRWGGSIAYTLAKAEQQGEYFFSLDDRYNRPKNYPRISAPNDQRHQVVMNGTVRAPFDIRLGTVISLGSGYPVFGTDASAGFGPGQRRTIVFFPPKRSFIIPNAFAYRRVDLRIEKAIPLAGGQNVSVLADLFNALNSANYGCFNVFIPPSPGVNAAYGTPGCASQGRFLQIGLRYGFRQQQ